MLNLYNGSNITIKNIKFVAAKRAVAVVLESALDEEPGTTKSMPATNPFKNSLLIHHKWMD